MQREAKNAAEGGKTGSHDIHGDLAEHRPVAGRPDMRVFYGFDALPHFVRPTVTVGSYDGVHSGHLALLRTVAGRARAQGGESVVLTFEPHPRVTLGRADGLRLLTSLEEKIYLLGQQGIDNLIVIPFDKAFSALAPDTFIRDYLVGRIGAETLVVGFNHRFGRDKQGSYDYLGSHGFGLEVVEVGECDVDAEKVSSTVIRRLVAQGDMAVQPPVVASLPRHRDGGGRPHPHRRPPQAPAARRVVPSLHRRPACKADGRRITKSDNLRRLPRRGVPS